MAPELRIVSDEAWVAAHDRLTTSRRNYLRHTNGRVWGRPANGVESKYLLTGMAVCAECGAGMLIRGRRYGSRRGYFYACGAAWHRGSCANDLEIPMEMADAAVLETIEQELLTPPVIEAAITRLVEREPGEDDEARRSRIQLAIRRVDVDLERLTTAITEGGPSRTLTAAIRVREEQREQLHAEVLALDAASRCPQTAESLNTEALRHLDEWRGLLGKNTSLARQLLRKVLDGRGRAHWTNSSGGFP